MLALQATPADPIRLLVGIDLALLGDLGGAGDSERILAPVRDALGLTDGRLLVNCSHTHSSPWAATSRSHMPGGELIGPYLDQLGQALLDAGLEAVAEPRARDADLGDREAATWPGTATSPTRRPAATASSAATTRSRPRTTRSSSGA